MLAAEQVRLLKTKTQLAESEVALREFTANERKFAELDRNVEILEANYRKYFANLEQVRIDTKMKNQEFSNVGVAQPATLNLKPSSPDKLINFVAAIFLGTTGGLGLAVFLEYLNPSLSSDVDVEVASGTDVIIRIPEMGHEQLAFAMHDLRKWFLLNWILDPASVFL